MAFMQLSWDKATKKSATNNDADNRVPLLFLHIENNDTQGVKSLLAAGVPVDARNELGETPLMLAVHRHQMMTVNDLLHGKADPNAATADGLTPLCYATQIGHWDMVDLLAQHGARISGKNTREFLLLNAALLRAMEEKDIEQISALTSAGVKDAEALRAKVFQLVEAGDWGRVEGCLNSGVPANLRDAQGNTLLMKAVEARAGKVIDVLIGFSADRDAKNKAGQTALSIAKDKQDAATVASLLAGGATAGIVMSPEELQKALTAAVTDGRLQMVDKLLNQGANPDQRTDTGDCLLRIAVDKKQYDIAARLMKAGANPGLVGNDFIFDLGVALIKGKDIAAITQFLDSKAVDELNAGSGATRQFSLLHVAAEGDVAIAKLVVQHFQALINRKESWDYSPLRVALMKKNLPMVEALLAAGSDPRMPGKSPDSIKMPDTAFAVLCTPEIAQAVTQAQEKFELMDAAARGDFSAVERAMQMGVPADLTDASGNAVLVIACQRGYTEIAKTLLSHGANPSRPGSTGTTPMMTALFSGSADIVRALGDAGASVMTPDSSGLVPVAYLDKPLPNAVQSDMRDAISYCRDLDIVRMAQHATQLENKTTVFKSLRFKTGSHPVPAAEGDEPRAAQLMETLGPVDDKPSMFKGLRFKVPAAP